MQQRLNSIDTIRVTLVSFTWITVIEYSSPKRTYLKTTITLVANDEACRNLIFSFNIVQYIVEAERSRRSVLYKTDQENSLIMYLYLQSQQRRS